MGAISALSTTGRTLERNGVLFGVAFAVALVNVVLTAGGMVLPPRMAGVVSLSLSGVSLFLTPFFMGGLLAMAYEGLDGTTSFGTFVDGGTSNYLRLIAAFVLFAVLLAAIWIVIVLAVAVVAVFTVGLNATGGAEAFAASGASLLVLVLVGLVGLFAVLLPIFFLQFYAPAVVVSDLGVVAAFKRSATLVRRNLTATLGYTLVAILIGAVAGAMGVVLTLLGGVSGQSAGAATPELQTSLLVGVFVVMVIVTTLLSAFGATYQVAFYTDVLGSVAGDEGAADDSL